MVPIENFVVLLQFNSVASPEWVPVNSSIMKVVNGTLHFCQRLVSGLEHGATDTKELIDKHLFIIKNYAISQN